MVAVRKTTPSSTPTTQHHPPRPTDYRDVEGSPGISDWIANALVLVFTWPILFIAKFLNAFVERGGIGIQCLGAIAFLGGVIAGADNYYQGFTGKALLPWFTKADWVGDLAADSVPQPLIGLVGPTVVGWSAVLFSLLSIGFLIALAFSLLTQFVQGQAVRGRSIAVAQADFEKWNAPTMPGKPDPERKLDMAAISWKELKRTGRSQRGFMGFIAIALWVSEFIAAFTAHNPLNYTGRPGLFLGCTVYALVTVAAGEIGYTLYVSAKEESGTTIYISSKRGRTQ